jgi:hypothetical protein
MPQFGAGSQLAAQCPTVPIPNGWRNWSDADGPIPDALAARARAIVADETIPLGTTESYPLPGVTTLIRIEPRVWGRDAQGNLIEGCFRTGGIFLPYNAPDAAGIAPPSTSRAEKVITALTIASLSVGTIATVVSLRRRRR